MEWNTVERALKTETDTRTEKKLVYIKDIYDKTMLYIYFAKNM